MILQRKSGIIDKNRNRVVQRVEVARIQSKTWQLISENFYRKCHRRGGGYTLGGWEEGNSCRQCHRRRRHYVFGVID
ncbi:hypothetical protein I4000191A8_18470 [Clostridia bacterium i40-0019-1A8]